MPSTVDAQPAQTSPSAQCVVGDMMIGMASQRQARIAALNGLIRDAEESIICAADFSPGPWWGFNGSILSLLPRATSG